MQHSLPLRLKTIETLLGRAFFQTEPDLLDCLRERERNKEGFQGRLATGEPTFHPKVWVIETSATTHVIVGSANLSHGGFVENTECSAHINDRDSVEAITGWFSKQWSQSSRLTPELCQEYREQYNTTKNARFNLEKAIEAAGRKLESAQIQWKRKEAIEQARVYFATDDGKRAAKGRREAMDRIRSLLKPPDFQIIESDWHAFLGIREFGSLNRIKRDTAKHLSEIRKAFLNLYEDDVPLAKRFDEVVPKGSKYHVDGIGRNIATKVLAMHHMPVYNRRVEDTLIAFGYPLGRENSEGERYSAFCREIRSFAKECGSDVLEIDAFFEHYSGKH